MNRQQTQTIVITDDKWFYGNCWQFAAAMVLNVPAYKLPDQVQINRWYDWAVEHYSGKWPKYLGWMHYEYVLEMYLWKHWGLVYADTWGNKLTTGMEVTAMDGFHIMFGPTPRTAPIQERTGRTIHHAVLAYKGQMVWDPHPSRAGLTEVREWGVITTPPPGFALREGPPCICPECGGLENYTNNLEWEVDDDEQKDSQVA